MCPFGPDWPNVNTCENWPLVGLLAGSFLQGQCCPKQAETYIPPLTNSPDAKTKNTPLASGPNPAVLPNLFYRTKHDQTIEHSHSWIPKHCNTTHYWKQLIRYIEMCFLHCPKNLQSTWGAKMTMLALASLEFKRWTPLMDHLGGRQNGFASKCVHGPNEWLSK